MARKVRRDSKIARRRVYARKHRRSHPKISLIKSLGFAGGAYLGAFGPSGNTAPQSAFDLLQSNPLWAANDLIDSVMGYNGNNHSWDFGELAYFYGPVAGGIILDAVAKKVMPGLKHMKVPFLKNVVVA